MKPCKKNGVFSLVRNSGRAGKSLEVGDIYFIDQYNREYSRDAEPMRGYHTDNYYYQLIDGIRRYKGVRQHPEVSAAKDY